ncbi:hypothetical protein E6O75_ATG05548 [Venturia nashicola]|uniref:Uncharacterized protein n=1 Tax=Venturia nashicola TaxID=86259 RepID=A0A4Z1PGP0_9PEZI|nr:hypothetical protein E6O75_ATG05548 [Venturia nashicola]
MSTSYESNEENLCANGLPLKQGQGEFGLVANQRLVHAAWLWGPVISRSSADHQITTPWTSTRLCMIDLACFRLMNARRIVRDPGRPSSQFMIIGLDRQTSIRLGNVVEGGKWKQRDRAQVSTACSRPQPDSRFAVHGVAMAWPGQMAGLDITAPCTMHILLALLNTSSSLWGIVPSRCRYLHIRSLASVRYLNCLRPSLDRLSALPDSDIIGCYAGDFTEAARRMVDPGQYYSSARSGVGIHSIFRVLPFSHHFEEITQTVYRHLLRSVLQQLADQSFGKSPKMVELTSRRMWFATDIPCKTKSFWNNDRKFSVETLSSELLRGVTLTRVLPKTSTPPDPKHAITIHGSRYIGEYPADCMKEQEISRPPGKFIRFFLVQPVPLQERGAERGIVGQDFQILKLRCGEILGLWTATCKSSGKAVTLKPCMFIPSKMLANKLPLGRDFWYIFAASTACFRALLPTRSHKISF